MGYDPQVLQTYRARILSIYSKALTLFAVSLKQSLGIDEIEVGKTHLYPVWFLALVKPEPVIPSAMYAVVEMACSINAHTLVDLYRHWYHPRTTLHS